LIKPFFFNTEGGQPTAPKPFSKNYTRKSILKIGLLLGSGAYSYHQSSLVVVLLFWRVDICSPADEIRKLFEITIFQQFSVFV
jgi:hypothetical protein